MTEKKSSLPENIQRKIDQWVTRYPTEQKRSGVLQALMFVQEHNGGYLTEALMDAVADYLEMPRIAVYEVATFYSLYHLKPVGRHVIDVCTNISCMLRDSQCIVDHIKKRLHINANETTTDGKFTLREVECLAACAAAPMMQIGKKYYENLTPEKVDTILDGLE
ncbi:NADH dehydrogenase [Gammaproteobacteria bacterium SCGC AG-212-F23]|nr:NADH dehydrogenase [Gammaproteobacteria bacterium SCGC AG-212-F23]